MSALSGGDPQHENQEQARKQSSRSRRRFPRGSTGEQRPAAGARRRQGRRDDLGNGQASPRGTGDDSGRNRLAADGQWAAQAQQSGQDPSESRRAGKKEGAGRMSSQRNSSSSICSRKTMPANNRRRGQSLRLEGCDPDPWTQFPPDQRGTGLVRRPQRGKPPRQAVPLITVRAHTQTQRGRHHHATTRSAAQLLPAHAVLCRTSDQMRCRRPSRLSPGP